MTKFFEQLIEMKSTNPKIYEKLVNWCFGIGLLAGLCFGISVTIFVTHFIN